VVQSTPTAFTQSSTTASRPARPVLTCDRHACNWPTTDSNFGYDLSPARPVDPEPAGRIGQPRREGHIRSGKFLGGQFPRPKYTSTRLRDQIFCIGKLRAELEQLAGQFVSLGAKAYALPNRPPGSTLVFFCSVRQQRQDSFHWVAWGMGEDRIVLYQLAGGIHATNP